MTAQKKGSLGGLKGAATLHSRYGYEQRSQWSREGAIKRFLRQVDPNNQLDEDERYRRATYAQKAWMAELSIRARKRRAARKESDH